MLSGRYQNKIDAKNRIILPAKLRNQIIKTYKHERPHMVITLSFFNPCLVVMSEEQWEKLGNYDSVDFLNPVVTDSFRLMSMLAYVEMDDVGRITIPDYLQEMVGISENVTILGCRSYMEIWDPDRADQNLRELQERASEVMSKLRRELKGEKPEPGDTE